MNYLFLLASLALLARVNAFKEVKVVDYFAGMCQSIIALNSAIACQGKSFDGESGFSECQCTNATYQDTLYQCIVDSSNMISDHRKALVASWQTAATNCEFSANIKLIPLDEIAARVARNPVTVSFEQANQSHTPMAFTVPKSMIQKYVIAAGEASHYNKAVAGRYAEARIEYLCGVMGLGIVSNFIAWFIPALARISSNNPVGRIFRRYVTLPALVGRHRAEPLRFLRWFQWGVPHRIHALAFFGYVALTIVLMSVNYKFHPSELTYLNTSTITRSYYVGLRAGSFATLDFPLVVLFAGRNNFLIWLTGWDQSVFLIWHRWVARLFTVILGIHAISLTVFFAAQSALGDAYMESYMAWGLTGLLGMFLACLTGFTRTIREKAYDLFVSFHVIFAIAAVLGAYHHVGKTGMFPQALFVVIAIWGFDRAMRITRILLNNPMAKATIEEKPGGVLAVTVSYSGIWTPTAGTYVYIHYLTPLWFWQSHPFTVVEPALNEDNGKIRLYTQAREGITDHLLSHGNREWNVWIDGPYGTSFNAKPYKEVVCIAGGIGITAVDSHLHHLLKQNHKHQNYYMHWVIRDDGPVEWFQSELKRLAAQDVQIELHITRGGNSTTPSSGANEMMPYTEGKSNLADPKTPEFIRENTCAKSGNGHHPTPSKLEDITSLHTVEAHQGRPLIEDLVREHIENASGPICFFVCGTGSMADDVRASVAANLCRTRHYVQFYEESFLM